VAIIETVRKRRTWGRYLFCCCCCCCTSEGSLLGLTSKAAALPANASAAAPQPSSTLYAAYVNTHTHTHTHTIHRRHRCRARLKIGISINRDRPPSPRTMPHVTVRQSFRSLRRAVIACTATEYSARIIVLCICVRRRLLARPPQQATGESGARAREPATTNKGES